MSNDEPVTLHGLFHEVIASTDLVTPLDIATEVFKRTPRKLIPDLYLSALRDASHTYLSRDRMHAREVVRAENTMSPAQLSGVVSHKVRQYQSGWEQAMNSRVMVDGQYKKFGECTFADMMAMSMSRRDAAARHAAIASQYERLAEAMKDREVETLADLDESVYREVVGS